MRNKIGNIYLFLIFGIFPLVFHDYYFDIFRVKYYFFVCITIVTFMILMFTNNIDKNKILRVFREKGMLCYIAFLFLALCSTVISKNHYAALTGNAGRNNGLLIYIVFSLGYIVLIQADRLYWEMFAVLEISGALVGSLAILNHYGVDPIGFMTEIGWNDDFMSTIGNVSSVVEYMVIVLAVSGMFFIIEENRKKSMFHGAVFTVSILSILLAGPDAAYGGLIFFYLFSVFAIKTAREKIHYIILIILLLIAFSGIGILNEQNYHFVVYQKNLSMITRALCKQRGKIYLLLLSLVIAGMVIYFFSKHSMKVWDRIPLKKIYAVVMVGAFVIMAGIFIAVNTGRIEVDPWTVLGKMKINDTWGTNRGYIWRTAWQYYKQLPVTKKILGIGPDTMYYVYEEMGTFNDGIAIDNAHFIPLQLLVTHGAAGLITWIGWIVGALYLCIKKADKSKRYYLIFIGIVTYYATAVFGINLISSSAVATLMIGLCFCQFSEENMSQVQKKKWVGNIVILVVFLVLLLGFKVVCQADETVMLNKLWME